MYCITEFEGSHPCIEGEWILMTLQDFVGVGHQRSVKGRYVLLRLRGKDWASGGWLNDEQDRVRPLQIHSGILNAAFQIYIKFPSRHGR